MGREFHLTRHQDRKSLTIGLTPRGCSNENMASCEVGRVHPRAVAFRSGSPTRLVSSVCTTPPSRPRGPRLLLERGLHGAAATAEGFAVERFITPPISVVTASPNTDLANLVVSPRLSQL